jgi:hypothetical protein
MNHDEQDKLWELLGKAREPKAAPFFASKVLRAIREEPVGLLAWLRRKWIIPATAVACALAVAFVAIRPVTTSNQQAAADPLTELAAYVEKSEDSAESLAALLASEDHSIWLQADPSSLY